LIALLQQIRNPKSGLPLSVLLLIGWLVCCSLALDTSTWMFFQYIQNQSRLSLVAG
jgi:hypothetical protein